MYTLKPIGNSLVQGYTQLRLKGDVLWVKTGVIFNALFCEALTNFIN
jgi:hypothetical protein